MKRFRPTILLIAILALPLISDACPLCQAGATKRTQKAYVQTTILLALLPLAGGGGIIYWFLSKAKKLKKDQDDESDQLYI